MELRDFTLTPELAQQIVNVILLENRPFDMDSYIKDVSISNDDPNWEPENNGDESISISVPRAKFPQYTCNSPACICGTAILLDENITHIRWEKFLESGVCGIHSVTRNDVAMSEFKYSRMIFGENHELLIFAWTWPKHMQNAYHCGVKNIKAAVAMVHFRNYCNQYLGFAPTLPPDMIEVASTAIDRELKKLEDASSL